MTIVDQSAAVTASSIGITVTASGSANTKGSYTELISSTSEETYWHTFLIKAPAAAADDGFLVDIAVGAAASESVIVANIPFFANLGGQIDVKFPYTIASGTRISVRCQSPGGGNTIEVMSYHSNDSGLGTSTVNETLGAVTASSRGTTIDPGATDNTKGGYTQLIASTAAEYNYLLIFLGNNNNNAQSNQSYLVDIAVGATPTVAIENILFTSGAAELSSISTSVYHTIASGTAVEAQCQSSAGNAAGATDRNMDITVIGFAITAPAGGSASGARNPFVGPIG